MRDDRQANEEVREFRLEGMTLLVTVCVLLVALFGAFYLGRRVERWNRPALAVGSQTSEDPLAHVAQTESPADVDSSSDYFDKVEGDQKEAEPSREARRDRPQPPAADEPAPETPRSSDGAFFVQVWAGRDRQAAELLVDKLQRDGYPVRLFSDRVENDSLFKVRVGGFDDESQARKVSEELEGKGYRGAWVTAVR